MLGLGTAGVLAGSRIQAAVDAALRPLSERDVTGLTDFLPGKERFRIYSVVGFSPERSRSTYELTVDGLVDRTLRIPYRDLVGDLPQTRLTKDFQCVTGWRVRDVAWQGVQVGDLLARAGVRRGATHLRFFSFDGAYTDTLTLDQARRPDVIVAHRMLGAPVTREHGGPVRLYVAPMYGYKSVKWLERIEVVDSLEPVGYWQERGYDVDAWVGRSNGRDDEQID
jgi:DMSO/TMAO reductase YedYZ molybdopterin-dependent catalytic subunit